MEIIREILNNLPRIFVGLDSAIDKSAVDTYERVKNATKQNSRIPGEVDFVIGLLLSLPQEIVNILRNNIRKKLQIRATSVFCHQSPKVIQEGKNTSTELGDILFVFAYTDENRSRLFNSYLFQAKVNNSGNNIVSLSKPELIQLELYEKWKKFEYQTPKELKGESRNILPKSISSGAKYLLINSNDTQATADFRSAVAGQELVSGMCLASELIGFLTFNFGRLFEENKNSTQDDWSKMIWDLLSLTNNFTKRSSGFKRSTGTRVNNAQLIVNQVGDSNFTSPVVGNYGDNSVNYFEGDDFHGISTFIIEIESADQEKNFY